MGHTLITGATGNIGKEVIQYFYKTASNNSLVAGVRDIEKAKKEFTNYPKLKYVSFDFEDKRTFNEALKNIDRVFLLRPPHLAKVNQHFNPFITSVREIGISDIVFLSVQGAEKSKAIPHHKIENLITENHLNYIFLRPSYFMQNLTTTLYNDIKNRREIILPSGRAKFNWVDIENIAEVSAILLNRFEDFKNKAFEITGLENLNFEEVTEMINQVVKVPLRYRSVNPIRFYWLKKQQGIKPAMILVMIMLHFLPRFSKEPSISGFYEQITGKKSTGLIDFIEREKHFFS